LDVAGDPDYSYIYENMFNYNTAAIDLEDVSRCMIYNNMINGNGAGTNNFIDLTGGANNFVANNYLACTIAQYDVTCSDATSGTWIGNYCTNGPTAAPPV
jgi:parallel beta-helix repeat protein